MDLAFIVQQSMYFIIPLLIVALGGMFAERSGVINIALEGIMLMGGFTGAFFLKTIQATHPEINPQIVLILACLVAAICGGVFSLLHAYAAVNLKADQVISGTALNLFAPAFAIFVTRAIQKVQQIGFNKDGMYIQKVPVLGDIPVIGPFFFRNVYITTYIGFAIFIISAVLIAKTRFGLRLRACGEYPQAADAVGINVHRIRYAGVIISGVLAGIGGLTFVVPTATEFNATVGGYGFLALAVLIFGNWRSFGLLGAALFFGLMKTFASIYSAVPVLKNLGIPGNVYKMIPYIATLVVLAIAAKRSQAPRAEGIPFEKGMR